MAPRTRPFVQAYVHRERAPVIAINSYAGSLVVAARMQGHKVVGSYEDAGYGLAIQRHNYPRLDYRATYDEWLHEKKDLRGHLVIAHPPCTAFSQMTTSLKSKHGLDAVKFQCTRKVLDYALGNKADAVAVESVMGAYEGARSVHEQYAAKHGYHLYRILQNGCTFGVPQWRERFWAIFVNRRLQLPDLIVHHHPVRTVVRDFLEDDREGPRSPVNPNLEKYWVKQHAKLIAHFDPPEVAMQLLEGEHGFGWLSAGLRNYYRAQGTKRDQMALSRALCVNGAFRSASLYVLNPLGLTPVLLHHSWWAVNGRQLTDLEYQRIMGFPDYYEFPEKEARQLRGFLSRGVCPPVAAWVLETMNRNLHLRRTFNRTGKSGRLKDETFRLRPGETGDLRPTRKLWAEEIKIHVAEGVR